MKYPVKIVMSVCLMMQVLCIRLPNGLAETEGLSMPEPSASAEGLAMPDRERPAEEPSSADIDFETYQRNIDDLFQISLMASPEMDQGINSVIVNLNRRIAENKDDPRPLISLGHVYRILGQPLEANRFYQKALVLDPENFHLNLFSALSHSQNKDFEKALERLNRALEINPHDSYALTMKGRILMILRRNDEAAAAFEKVLEEDPENRQVAFGLSLIYERTGKYQKAQELLEKLSAAAPDDLFVAYHLGALALADGNAAGALEQWKTLFNSGVRDTQFLFNLAIAYISNNEGEKAEKILEHLRFFYPDERTVEMLLAEAYRQLDRLEDAERQYRLVLTEQPRNLSAYVGLAHVLEQEGKEEEKQEVLEQASSVARRAREQELAAERVAEFQQQTGVDLSGQ